MLFAAEEGVEEVASVVFELGGEGGTHEGH
jgi:hypothetical protein